MAVALIAWNVVSAALIRMLLIQEILGLSRAIHPVIYLVRSHSRDNPLLPLHMPRICRFSS